MEGKKQLERICENMFHSCSAPIFLYLALIIFYSHAQFMELQEDTWEVVEHSEGRLFMYQENFIPCLHYVNNTFLSELLKAMSVT